MFRFPQQSVRPAGRPGNCVPTAGSSASPSGVDVVGTGKIVGTPDIVRLDLGMTAARSQAASSFDAANAATSKVIRALTKCGVKSKDIKTAGMSLVAATRVRLHEEQLRHPRSRRVPADRGDPAQSAYCRLGSRRSCCRRGDAARVNGLALNLEGDSKLLAQAGDRHHRNHDLPQPIGLDRNAAADLVGSKVPVQPGSHQVSVSVRISR